MRLRHVLRLQFPVHTEIIAFQRYLFANVQAPNFLDDFLLRFREPLTLQQITGPRWNHQLDSVGIGARQLLVETPAKCPISEMNQTQLPHPPKKFTTVQRGDLKLERYRNRSVARLRIINESTHYVADRWRIKAERGCEIN